MNGSKTPIVIQTVLGKALSIGGYVLGGISLLILLVLLFDDGFASEDTVIFMIFFVAPTAALIIGGTRISRRVRRFKKYVTIMSAGNTRSIDDIAKAANKTTYFVAHDLQAMIIKRFFSNAVIRGDEVVFLDEPTATMPALQTHQTTTPSAQAALSKPINATCKGCGVSVTLQNVPVACEYCGSIMK